MHLPSQEHVIIFPTMCHAAARHHNWTVFILCIEYVCSFSPRLCLIARMAFVFSFMLRMLHPPGPQSSHQHLYNNTWYAWLAFLADARFSGDRLHFFVFCDFAYMCAPMKNLSNRFMYARKKAQIKFGQQLCMCTNLQHQESRLETLLFIMNNLMQTQEHNFLGLKVVALRMYQ